MKNLQMVKIQGPLYLHRKPQLSTQGSWQSQSIIIKRTTMKMGMVVIVGNYSEHFQYLTPQLQIEHFDWSILVHVTLHLKVRLLGDIASQSEAAR
jgi:hypothetical protein